MGVKKIILYYDNNWLLHIKRIIEKMKRKKKVRLMIVCIFQKDPVVNMPYAPCHLTVIKQCV